MGEVEAKTSSTLAVTPAGLMSFVNAPQWAIPDMSQTVAVTSTGTTVIGPMGVRLNIASAGSASGNHAARTYGVSSNTAQPHYLIRGDSLPSLSSRILLAARVRMSTVANAVHRLTFGKTSQGIALLEQMKG
jgi:hypothetical protein